MKHTNEQPLAFAMGKLMGERLLLTLVRLPDYIIPMPTHWRRRLRRGSNPAETLAAGVSQVTQMPICSGRLRVRRLTRKQSLLTPSQRRSNVKGAFAVRPSWRGGDLPLLGKQVALIDDAVTTGATVEAAASTLKRAGVASILVVAVARANR